MTKEQRRQMRRQQVDAYFASGQESIKKWCASNGVDDSTLRYWIRVFEKERAEHQQMLAAPSGWLEVDTFGAGMQSAIEPISHNPCLSIGSPIIARIGPVEIEIPQDADEEMIERVFRAARRL